MCKITFHFHFESVYEIVFFRLVIEEIRQLLLFKTENQPIIAHKKAIYLPFECKINVFLYPSYC